MSRDQEKRVVALVKTIFNPVLCLWCLYVWLLDACDLLHWECFPSRSIHCSWIHPSVYQLLHSNHQNVTAFYVVHTTLILTMHMRQNLRAVLPLWLRSSDALGLSQMQKRSGAMIRTFRCRSIKRLEAFILKTEKFICYRLSHLKCWCRIREGDKVDVSQLTVHMTRQPSKHNTPIVALMPFLALVSTEVIGVENGGYSYNCVIISTSSQWVWGDVGIKVLYVAQ